ncbi:hypothetical protein GGP78_003188 [Salinibacter ruber]|uniref:hypothetical protein n=1 Tax=Salinibacter ruber TaxID=146919 RepID=UPI0021696950|nr:hypothetical protein [Salinibacter ruber]MCS3856485.1 hypothetical protein [Salinibacter ruber]
MPNIYGAELTTEERAILTDKVERRSRTAPPVKRAFVLLKADEAAGGPFWPDWMIDESYEVSIRTVTLV